MKDLWTATTDMLLDISDKYLIESSDHLYYMISSNGHYLGSIKKSYENHDKVIHYQFRNGIGTIKQSSETESDVAKLVKIINTAEMLNKIKNL